MSEYKRLSFGQYFIDTSKDWRDTGKARFDIEYNHVEYVRKLFGFIPLKCSAEWECHYEEDRNVIQVNFEQTHGWKDWIVNLLFSSKPYDEFVFENVQVQLRACKGWMQMFFMMKHQVREAVSKLYAEHPNAEVEIIGWSLGSSQAQYCAQDLFFNFGIRSYLYTDGSVKPWKKPLSKKKAKTLQNYLAKCTKACYNFMERRDIVTYMPPLTGYFAMNPVKLGKFQFKELFKPNRWHTEYGEDYEYKEIV